MIRDCEVCSVKTMKGKVAKSVKPGHGVRNKKTYVLSTTEAPIEKKCRLVRSYKSIGEVYSYSDKLRLRHVKREINFLFGENIALCGSEIQTSEVLGNRNLKNEFIDH